MLPETQRIPNAPVRVVTKLYQKRRHRGECMFAAKVQSLESRDFARPDELQHF